MDWHMLKLFNNQLVLLWQAFMGVVRIAMIAEAGFFRYQMCL